MKKRNPRAVFLLTLVMIIICGLIVSTSIGVAATKPPAPTPVSPGIPKFSGSFISTTTPVLSWNPVSGALSYAVIVNRLKDNFKVYTKKDIKETRITVPANCLAPGERYWWTVLAFNGSAYSEFKLLYFEVTKMVYVDFNYGDSIHVNSSTYVTRLWSNGWVEYYKDGKKVGSYRPATHLETDINQNVTICVPRKVIESKRVSIGYDYINIGKLSYRKNTPDTRGNISPSDPILRDSEELYREMEGMTRVPDISN